MRYIIVGGTSGVGLAAVRLARQQGHSVVAAARNPAKFAAPQAVGATTVALDAADPAQCAHVFRDLGAFDHLLLSASGAGGAGSFRSLALTDLRAGFEAKFWPYLNCLKSALTTLSATGSIVLVSAISARAAQPATAGLAAINAALEAMVPILASELRPIRVNAVAPGVIDTPWWDRVAPETRLRLFEEMAQRVPVGRLGTPEEVAEAMLFLTTNTFITGSVVD